MENDNIKLEIKIQPSKNEEHTDCYEATVSFDVWNQYHQHFYQYLVEKNTAHLKIDGFRNRNTIPHVLLEMKYKDLFEQLKQESFQFVLAHINMKSGEIKNTKFQIKTFSLEPSDNSLMLVLIKNKETITNAKVTKINEQEKKNKDKKTTVKTKKS